MVGGEGLQGIETATSLRITSGKVKTMDGPFAETREHLGGYYVIDVPDLDIALRYAAMIPGASLSPVSANAAISATRSRPPWPLRARQCNLYMPPRPAMAIWAW